MVEFLCQHMDFSSRLLSWYGQNGRSLPWRGSKDPYQIWISEVILQQTRVEQGQGYFNRFMEAFPDVHTLAAASEDRVMRLWQGLGYYSRARHLHQSARYIADHHGGTFPQTSAGWLRLKGVGHYTAAAIASIAFNEAVPALDGNGLRILARLFAFDESIDGARGKSVLYELARRILPADRPGDFNQAMMDFGSVVCKPVRPRCITCIFHSDCAALRKNAVQDYPVRKTKKPVKTRFFNYFFLYFQEDGEEMEFFVSRRTGNDIWRHMYEFPLLETSTEMTTHELFAHHAVKRLLNNKPLLNSVYQVKHRLTHQLIVARFFPIRLSRTEKDRLTGTCQRVNREAFEGMAKPKLIERFCDQVMDRYSAAK